MATKAYQRNISIYKKDVFKTETRQNRTTSVAAVLQYDHAKALSQGDICCHTHNPRHSPTMHFMCRYGSTNRGKRHHGMARAVCCRSLNAESWVQLQGTQSEFVVDKATLGQVLHQVLQFPISLTTQTLHT